MSDPTTAVRKKGLFIVVYVSACLYLCLCVTIGLGTRVGVKLFAIQILGGLGELEVFKELKVDVERLQCTVCNGVNGRLNRPQP